VSKAESSSRHHPREKTVRVSSGLDPRILVRRGLHLFWCALVDFQPSQITVGRTEERTRSQQNSFIVKLGEVCHVSVLKPFSSSSLSLGASVRRINSPIVNRSKSIEMALTLHSSRAYIEGAEKSILDRIFFRITFAPMGCGARLGKAPGNSEA